LEHRAGASKRWSEQTGQVSGNLGRLPSSGARRVSLPKAQIDEPYNTRMRTPMIGNRMCTIALSAASAIICSAPPAIAANVDGNWSMVAETTRGHCGTIDMGLGINRGRIYSTGGSFAFYPIRLGGRVSASGHVRLNAVAGPRTAHGTGRFGRFRGSGTWAGRGPSGLCSGVWSANRS
jgi:hypothetical protein